MEYVMILWLVGSGYNTGVGVDLNVSRALTFPTKEACEEAFTLIARELKKPWYGEVVLGHACVAQTRT